MKHFIFFIVALVPMSLSAQLLYNNFESSSTGTLFRDKVGKPKSSGNIEGSPYSDERFLPAEIPGIATPVLSRYNMDSDQVEVKIAANDEDTYVLPKRPEYGRITFYGKKYCLVLAAYVNSDNETITGYLVKLHEAGTIGLFRSDRVIFRKGKVAESNYDTTRPDRWEKESGNYYITAPDGRVVAVPRNTKDFASLYPADKADAIKKFLKSSGYSLKKENDLTQLVTFLSTL